MLLTNDTTQDTVKSWAEELLRGLSSWKLLLITVHLNFFLINSCRKSRRSGPIIKPEISEAERVWVRIAQRTGDMATNLELAKDEAGLTRCYGWVKG